MKDMLMIIYDALRANDFISSKCEDRIKFYLYPETEDTSKPFITIRPLSPPEPTTHASDISLSVSFLFQIDVQSENRMECKEIQKAIYDEMKKLGFGRQTGGLDDYLETKRFVDARRYSLVTQIYDTEY